MTKRNDNPLYEILSKIYVNNDAGTVIFMQKFCKYIRLLFLIMHVTAFFFAITGCNGLFETSNKTEAIVRDHVQENIIIAPCLEGVSLDCVDGSPKNINYSVEKDFEESPSSSRNSENKTTETQIVQLELTLENAVARALQFNRGLLNRRLDREAEKLSLELAEEKWQPRYFISPSLDATSDEQTVRITSRAELDIPTGGTVSVGFPVTTTLNAGRTGPRRITLNFSHPLFRRAGREIATAQIRRERISEKISILSLRDTVANLVVTVEQGYRSLIAAQQQVEIAEAAVKRARDQYSLTQTLIDAGRRARRELIRSQATLANRDLALARARTRFEVANFNFVSVLGLDAKVRIRPLDSLQDLREIQAENVNIPTLNQVLQKRTDFQTAQLQLTLARMSLDLAENNLLPSVSMTIGVSRDLSLERGSSNTSVGFNANIPLNDRQPELQHLSARNALKKAEGNLSDLHQSIEVNLSQASNGFEESLVVIELAKNARELAEENLDIERQKFDQGLSSAFEVSAIGDELVQAERAEIDAISAYLDAVIQLDRATGQILERRGIQLDFVVP
ncbi:MAG: TolC family protein [Aestuariivita sp.]|nr:TolC family protein [Aestuariivita sp.]